MVKIATEHSKILHGAFEVLNDIKHKLRKITIDSQYTEIKMD